MFKLGVPLSTDQHTLLGKGALPGSIVSLLSIAYKDKAPDQSIKNAVFELFRLAANLCMDHGACIFCHRQPLYLSMNRCKPATIPGR